tara:strand:+ start:413 stop:712 length:300 start_codon:yes stop_codon:yes gene_type:complete
MVENIKSVVANRVNTPQNKQAQALKSELSATVGANKNSIDSIDVKADSVKLAVAGMASNPPIDVEAVARIKDAIANGKYPVDLDKISDMLMDAYRDLKS